MDKNKPIIVFATCYAQWLWFCRWKDIAHDTCHRIVDNSGYTVESLLNRGIAPVSDGNVIVLPGAKYTKTHIKKLIDQASI